MGSFFQVSTERQECGCMGCDEVKKADKDVKKVEIRIQREKLERLRGEWRIQVLHSRSFRWFSRRTELRSWRIRSGWVWWSFSVFDRWRGSWVWPGCWVHAVVRILLLLLWERWFIIYNYEIRNMCFHHLFPHSLPLIFNESYKVVSKYSQLFFYS